jgi:hypothetical protein
MRKRPTLLAAEKKSPDMPAARSPLLVRMRSS